MLACLRENYSAPTKFLYQIQNMIPAKSERCVAATQILSKFHPIVLNEHSPLSTVGDGNCLYRAVSLAFFGTEELHGHLRLLASLEIIENRSHYDTAHRKYVDLICDNRIVSSDYMSLV